MSSELLDGEKGGSVDTPEVAGHSIAGSAPEKVQRDDVGGDFVRDIKASPQCEAAIVAVASLLAALRIDHAFVGDVAIAAWLETTFDSGSVDVLALVSADRSRQLPMMAANRGFRVDQAEVESAEELDLIPMYHREGEDEVRIHILLATNALYAKMVAASIPALIGGVELRILDAEDMALLLMLTDGPEATMKLQELIVKAGDSFESDRFNRRLVSIGLGGKLVSR